MLFRVVLHCCCCCCCCCFTLLLLLLLFLSMRLLCALTSIFGYPLIVQPLAPYMVLVHHIFTTLQYTFETLLLQELFRHNKYVLLLYFIRGMKYSKSKRSFIITLMTHHTVHSPNFHIIFCFSLFSHQTWVFALPICSWLL